MRIFDTQCLLYQYNIYNPCISRYQNTYKKQCITYINRFVSNNKKFKHKMRSFLYMFNQRSTKCVLPVFFICTLFLSFSSVNIFCRPPSLLSTSSTTNNNNDNNNNNYCNGNTFLVSATYIRSKNPRHATKQHGLTIKEIAKGEVDGLDIMKQYELDRAHPPKPESMKDKNGLPNYNMQSLYVDGFPKTKKLVDSARKMFPHYQISPNRLIEPLASHTATISSLSKFSEDPKVYGMHGAGLRGGAPNIGLQPNNWETTDPNTGGPSLLYQQYSTHQYDMKLSDVADPIENAHVLKNSIIQDPIKQRHFNAESVSGKAFMMSGQYAGPTVGNPSSPGGPGNVANNNNNNNAVAGGGSNSAEGGSNSAGGGGGNVAGSSAASSSNLGDSSASSSSSLKGSSSASFESIKGSNEAIEAHQLSAEEHERNADHNENEASQLREQAKDLSGEEKEMVMEQANTYQQSAQREHQIAAMEDKKIADTSDDADDSDGEEEEIEQKSEQREQQQQQSGQGKDGDPGMPCKRNAPGKCGTRSQCEQRKGMTPQPGYCNGGSENICCVRHNPNEDKPPVKTSGSGSCPGQQVWQKVLNNPGIQLNNFHPSGVQDNADPKKQVQAAAQGMKAERSSYGNAPGGSTCLSPRVAEFLLKLGNKYGGVGVNSIAGASHSKSSSHYRGTTIDVGKLKGRVLNDVEMAKLVVNTCVLEMGGAAISNPGGRKIPNTKNFGGHKTWVHCGLRL